MAEAVEGGGGISGGGDDAGVEMIDDAGQRPVPAWVAEIRNVVACAAQPPSKECGLHLTVAKAV